MSRSPAPLALPAHRTASLSLRKLVSALHHALRLRKSRRDLAALDAHMLTDIGLSPEQAREESLRRLWDAPASWQKPD